MKILQINAVGQTMSTGRTCREFQDFVNSKTEHECRTAFAQGKEDAFSIRIGNPVDWKLHGLFSRLSGKQAHFSRLSTLKLLQYIERYQPDAVMLRNLHGNYIHLPMLLRYLANNDIATVAVLHDCWFYTGKCTHYTVTGCDRWKNGCHHCPRLKMDNPSWFIDAAKQLWQEKKALFEAIPHLAVIGVSDWIANEARQSCLACAKVIRRIYNWIDLELFSPQENSSLLREKYNLTGKKVVLGVASGWSRAKGLDTFGEIAAKLGERYRIVLIGQMPSGWRLPENLLHIPPTGSAKELAEYYSMADVFVTTSLEESFGKVSAEALACGTPVVCFDSTANRELTGTDCGKSVPVNDIDAMIKAIDDFAHCEAADLQKKCRQFATANFDKEKCLNEYFELFSSLEKLKKISC